MSIIEAIIMGIVQGITEFLPVSSSGHLAIFRGILNLDLDEGILFEVMLHFGTLLAIFAVYYDDIFKLIIEGLAIVKDFIINVVRAGNNLFAKNKKEYIHIIHTPYRRFVMLVIVASIPTGLAGLYLKRYIDGFFSNLLIVGIALLVTGSLLYVTDKIEIGTKEEEKTTYKNAFVLGVFQSLAIIPGISRSGSTIVGGLLNGLSKSFAIKFSFIMSIPPVLGATLLELKDVRGATYSNMFSAPYLIGTLISAVVGFICIKTLIVLLRNRKLHYFSYYCFVIGIITIINSFRI
ncbi:undecaprenyl-diphosphatase [Natranaerovirga hydrolytica]|uniref:Undecaprenyl-diphosphatase n=1 Tax=Natranaerovirga hydrolytica TaxID=680378 RepID=A0A4R1MZG3_9FIRM|nr:undecaprenyl-diphosphate phosphatase [Natranaerovirga hydrolytica]TCK97952.1 undecaprenyl-diphosphatase [Natranaerovirga hydrolytica]